MPELPELKWKTVEPAKVDRLACWLWEWQQAQEQRRAAVEQLPPTPQSTDAAGDRTILRGRVAQFDSSLAVAQIRLMSSTVLPKADRPVYFAILDAWGEDTFLVAPFGPFLQPATTTEWRTAHEEPPLRVLCLWNVRTWRVGVLKQSWLVDCLTPAEREDAWSVFRHAATGNALDDRLLVEVGSPISCSDDPRLLYQAEEMRIFTAAVKESADQTRAMSEDEFVPREPLPGSPNRSSVPNRPKLGQPLPRWTGRSNLPNILEGFITSAEDLSPKEEEQLALAAESTITEFVTKRWRALSLDVRLLMSPHADREKIQLVVSGEQADMLNNAKLVSPEGFEITEVKNRTAVIDTDKLRHGFILIGPDGSPLTLEAI